MQLTGKVALITGGAIRVGKVIAQELAKAGADIVISYVGVEKEARNTKFEIEQLGRRCLTVEADMRSIPQLKNLITKTEKEFGRLDFLIHNASNFNEAPIEEVTEEMWDSSLEIILKGAFFLSQAAIPLMKKRKSAKIIALIGNSYYENWPNYIPHSIAKTGLVKLIQGLSVALSPHIQCAAVCPGTIMESAVGGYSPVLEDRAEIINESTGLIEVSGQKIIKGDPYKLAELIIFLCGSSNYLNGVVIPIDGGKYLL